MRIIIYIVLKQKKESLYLKKLMCTSFSILIVTIISLFCITIYVNLLPQQKIHKFLRLLGRFFDINQLLIYDLWIIKRLLRLLGLLKLCYQSLTYLNCLNQ